MMGQGSMSGSFEVKGQGQRPAFHTINHPVTGDPILLRDPTLEVVGPVRSKIDCDDMVSFAAGVQEVRGENYLVELRGDGQWQYMDELGGDRQFTVVHQLPQAETSRVLGSFREDQRGLLQFMEQYPDALVPQGDEGIGDATMDQIRAYSAKSVRSIEMEAGESSVKLAIDRDDDIDSVQVPRYWTGVSPWFEGGAEQRSRLRLDVNLPEIEPDGKIVGSLAFVFKLWSPSPRDIIAAAMADAMQRMQALLPPEYKLIRGTIV